MNNHMSLKLVGASSSLEINSPITSIYLQEELTGLTTLPGIRETKGMNIGMDGGWTSAQFYEPRLITIKGVIANQDVAVVEQRRKQLIQLLAEKRLALEFQTEAGNHYTMNVVVAGVQMPLSKVLTASYFQLSLRADDPLIYDNNALAELEAILRRSSSASSGFSINFPINFQLGVSESRPTIDNFGSSVIYPVITLTGPLTTPEIVNITTNMAFTIDEVLGAGTYTASGIRGAMTQEGSVDTYSGNPIQATRDAESPISKFSLYGNATQTTYSGKNLLENKNHTRTYLGITFTKHDDGSFTVNGTSTGNAQFYLTADGVGYQPRSLVLPAGTYTINGRDSGGVKFECNYEVEGVSGSRYATGTFTATAPITCGIYVNITNGTTVNNLTIYPQLEAGSTATSFEPYVGGTASPNPDYPQAVNTVTGEQTTGITGKNLIDQDAMEQGSFNYITNANNSDNSRIRSTIIQCSPNTTYTLGANEPLGEWAVIYYDQERASFAGTGGNTRLSYRSWTTPENAYFMRIRIGNAEYPKTAGTDYNLMLTEGSAAAYEPYRGQDYEIYLPPDTLDNMFEQGSFTASGINDVANNRVRTKNYIPCEGSTQYKIYASTSRSGKTLQTSVSYYTTDDYTTARISFQNWIAVPESGATITTPANAKYMRVLLAFNDNINIVPSDVHQVKLRSDVFTPIELAKIGNYQDRIYKTDGKWYIEKQVGKVVYDGSETGWYAWSTNVYSIGQSLTTIRESLCDYFTFASNVQTAGALPDKQYCWTSASNGYVPLFKNTDIASVADFKTWLSTHPTTVYYALATPTTTEITNEALIDQLDAILEAHLYDGINNISNVTISPNLAGDLEIKTGQTLTVINSLSIVGSSGTAEIDLGGAELAMVGSVADELTINGTTGAVTKTTRIGKIESYAGETITTDYISTSGGLDSDATIYYVLPSSSTSVINTLDSTALTAFNNVVASGGVSAQTNIGSISVDVATVTAQDVAVVDTKQHTVTINGVGAYSKFSGDWLTLDVGLNELQLITENNTDTGSAVIKYRVGYMGV